MNKDEMIKDKEQMARIIAFELCPHRHHKELYGEGAKCCADNNFGDCAKIKEVVDKLYNEGYRKVGEDEIVITKDEYKKLRSAKYDALTYENEVFKIALEKIEQAKQETAREIIDKIENLADIEIKKGGNCEKYFDMVLDLLDKELE